jgi:hypothetical protein
MDGKTVKEDDNEADMSGGARIISIVAFERVDVATNLLITSSEVIESQLKRVRPFWFSVVSDQD